jgi:hypothetical protein
MHLILLALPDAFHNGKEAQPQKDISRMTANSLTAGLYIFFMIFDKRLQILANQLFNYKSISIKAQQLIQ